MYMLFLLNSAPSWNLSKPENLASTSLQDGATKWHYSGTLFRKYVWCPPSRYTLFCAVSPPPNLVLCIEHFGSVLDFEQN